ncbi:MAG TPA: hypothetical protein VJB13_02250 [Candidatus Nanoarchaeia archaeon]|nr:hypothetical protein [Candidatus Nanoarchaeia archaeon]
MKNFRRKKSYGEYQVAHCPFCQKIATFKNEQGLNVCKAHLQQKMEEIRCTCGSWLENRSGKFGPYFHCVKCGNINYNKGLAMKEMTTPIKVDEPKKMITEFSEYKKKKEPVDDYEERKETIISSRDSEYFD